MVASLIGISPSNTQAFPTEPTGGGRLGPHERKALSVEALGGSEPVSRLARRHRVSRKFIYQQAAKATDALDAAFATPGNDDHVLFDLPVTKNWLRQLVLAEVLICHSSFRGVGELFSAVLDLPGPSEGTVHRIVQQAIGKARAINDAQDLSGIRVGAHDEIFQAGKPVLVGVDVDSTYCYLLAQEDHRDETTWGVHLLDLAAQGLRPDYTIADFGRGLRAGQAGAWDGLACHGDVFHPEWNLSGLASYLEHRAAGRRAVRRTLERTMERSKKRCKGQHLSKRLAVARQAEATALRLAEDVRTLADWMTDDILSLAGPNAATRRGLYDFVVEELRQREKSCPHRIRPVRTLLEGHRDNLLAFADILDRRFVEVATRLDVPLPWLHAVCELQGQDRNQAAYWRREARLRQKLGKTFHAVQSEVRRIMAQTPRASSIVENYNSRLRGYFFLRRQIGHGYLDLLRFFLNHRGFPRSQRPERVGKSPTELLTGRRHAHWLELLGFERFRRN
jgi:hypothetical protein